MKNIPIITLTVWMFSFAALIISCSNENKNAAETASSPDSNSQTLSTVGSDANPSLTESAPATTSSPAPARTPSPAPQNSERQPVATAPGMNPPHGEPGHKCEIAVGAPLNSAPASPTAPVPSITPQPQAGTTAPGMNPPHGEPGHDCAIPVGSPLKK